MLLGENSVSDVLLAVLDELAPESHGVSLQYVKLGLFNQVCVLFLVAAAMAAALRPTVDAFGKTFTVELEAPGLAAGALWPSQHSTRSVQVVKILVGFKVLWLRQVWLQVEAVMVNGWQDPGALAGLSGSRCCEVRIKGILLALVCIKVTPAKSALLVVASGLLSGGCVVKFLITSKIFMVSLVLE